MYHRRRRFRTGCSDCTGREGASVLVIERMDKTGKKILATGNGKCNLTNQAIRRGCISSGVYRSGQEVFPLHVLENFDAGDTLAFFESMGLYTKARDGYVYPMSEQAASVRDILCWKLAEQKADVVTGQEVKKIRVGAKVCRRAVLPFIRRQCLSMQKTDHGLWRRICIQAWQQRFRIQTGRVSWTSCVCTGACIMCASL